MAGVTLEQFHHVCHAVANLVSADESIEVTAIGSSAILPWHDQDGVWLSKDVDIVLDERTESVVEVVGEGSHFDFTHGVYAEGVPLELFVTRSNWSERAKRYENPHFTPTGMPKHWICVPHPIDLVTAKLVRGDEKDIEFAEFCCQRFSDIDWNAIGKSLRDTLQEHEAAERETGHVANLKAAIAMATARDMRE
ncbi:MAG: hypothetical protein R3F62_26875 [Planctomycetota bacterium]